MKQRTINTKLAKAITSCIVAFASFLCSVQFCPVNSLAAEPAKISAEVNTEQTFTVPKDVTSNDSYTRINTLGRGEFNTRTNLLSQKTPLALSMDLVSNGSMTKIGFGTSQALNLTKFYDCSAWKSDEIHNVTFVFYPDTTFVDPGTTDGADYIFSTELYIDNKLESTQSGTRPNTGVSATYQFLEVRFFHIYSTNTEAQSVTVKNTHITNKIEGSVEAPTFNTGNTFFLEDDVIFGYSGKTVNGLKSLNPNASVLLNNTELTGDTPLAAGMVVKLTNTYDTVSLSSSYTLADNDSGVPEPAKISAEVNTEQTFTVSEGVTPYTSYTKVNTLGQGSVSSPTDLYSQKNPVALSMDLVSNGSMTEIGFGTSQLLMLSEFYDCSAWKSDEIHNVTFVFYPDTAFVDPGTSDGADYVVNTELYIDNKLESTHSFTRPNTGDSSTYHFSELRFFHRYSTNTEAQSVTVKNTRITNQIKGSVEVPAFNIGDVFFLKNNVIFGYTGKTVNDLKSLNSNASVLLNNTEVTGDTPLAAGMIVKLTNTYDTVSLSSSYTLADNDSGVFAQPPQGYSNGYPSDKFTEGTFTVKTSVFAYGNSSQLTGYLAQFDYDGRLINLGEICTVTTENNTSTNIEASINITKAAGSTLKFMLWDSNMKPCLAASVFEPYSASSIDVVKTYPNYSTKAATFSFDDGIVQDIALISSLDKYNAKATFNLVGSRITANFSKYGSSDSEIYEYVKELYKNHEIGNHSYNHTPAHLEEGETSTDSYGTPLIGVSAADLAKDINDNQSFIEENLNAKTRGIAWANGLPFNRSDYAELKASISETGHVYTRDTSTIASFTLPQDWMKWKVNGHIAQMTEKTDQFIETPSTDGLKLMYIWGHAYEFGSTSVGTLADFENNLAKLQNADVWFATNIEIYDYITAMNKLDISDNVVTNHSDKTLYMYVNGKKIVLEPNESYSPSSLTIACWGDSLTYGQGATDEASGINSYPGILSSLTGENIYNLGIGGETAMTIAARQGAVHFTPADDFTIPASGSVDVPLASVQKMVDGQAQTFYYLPAVGGGYVVPRNTNIAKWNPVTIAGVEGTLSADVSYKVSPRLLTGAKFTRTTPGDAVTVSKNDRFITSAEKVNDIADINIFFTGTNGGWNSSNSSTDPQDLVNLINSQINMTKDRDKYIVIGLTNGNASANIATNKALEEAFGEHFLDAKAYFTSEQALKDAGISSGDSSDGVAIPKEFTVSDRVHFNDLGYKLLAKLVYNKLNELNYLN